MKEYTILSIVAALLTLWADEKSGVRVCRRKLFWWFLLVIAGFKFWVNGYLTGRQIVVYNPRFFLGIRIGPIPVEDFLFGFSMVTMTIIFWEMFKKGSRCGTYD
ncbi:MAG: lycopene cyclase domain-containing protein [Candidatus Omnitrophica bacterium]|nr:lycopene cyclase domain-containing protein [Candidatus Omnitrophota bacterium]